MNVQWYIFAPCTLVSKMQISLWKILIFFLTCFIIFLSTSMKCLYIHYFIDQNTLLKTHIVNTEGLWKYWWKLLNRVNFGCFKRRVLFDVVYNMCKSLKTNSSKKQISATSTSKVPRHFMVIYLCPRKVCPGREFFANSPRPDAIPKIFQNILLGNLWGYLNLVDENTFSLITYLFLFWGVS